MGQLIRLINATKADITESTAKYQQLVRVDGYTETLATGYSIYSSLCFRNTTGTNFTSAGTNYLFPFASSDTSVDYNKTNITNQVGTCVVSYNYNSSNTGWIANITITGSGLQDETVNSILFTRRLYIQSGATQEFLLCAYILDSPITLNAENNYTATLTMSVTFE